MHGFLKGISTAQPPTYLHQRKMIMGAVGMMGSKINTIGKIRKEHIFISSEIIGLNKNMRKKFKGHI